MFAWTDEPDDRAETIARAAEDEARTERYIGDTGYVDPADYRAAREFG